jgi:hypothetical protein
VQNVGITLGIFLLLYSVAVKAIQHVKAQLLLYVPPTFTLKKQHSNHKAYSFRPVSYDSENKQ